MITCFIWPGRFCIQISDKKDGAPDQTCVCINWYTVPKIKIAATAIGTRLLVCEHWSKLGQQLVVNWYKANYRIWVEGWIKMEKLENRLRWITHHKTTLYSALSWYASHTRNTYDSTNKFQSSKIELFSISWTLMLLRCQNFIIQTPGYGHEFAN